jgi:hypothetical protein
VREFIRTVNGLVALWIRLTEVASLSKESSQSEFISSRVTPHWLPGAQQNLTDVLKRFSERMPRLLAFCLFQYWYIETNSDFGIKVRLCEFHLGEKLVFLSTPIIFSVGLG